MVPTHVEGIVTYLVFHLQPSGSHARGGDSDLAHLHAGAVRAGTPTGVDQPAGLPVENTGHAFTPSTRISTL